MGKWWAKKLHSSWQMAAFSAGLIAGVATVIAMPLTLIGWEWLFAGLLVAIVAVIKQTRWSIILAVVGGSLVGLSLGSFRQVQIEQYAYFYNKEVTLSGKIAEDPTISTQGQQSLQLSNIEIGQHKLTGKIWVSTASHVDLKRGDLVTVQGDLNTGFGNVPASMFRVKLLRAERPQPGDVARRLRDWFANGVRQAISEPQASLGIGYLVGQRTALPETLADQFKLLGLSHLVVASGANLVIIVRLLRRSLARFSKRLATTATFGFIAGFLMITGFSTSMVRAAIVAGLSLLAWYYGRNVHPVVLLLLAAAITLVIDPSFLWGDVGWYLSFAAFAGVILLAPLINHYFWGSKEPGAFRYIFVSSIAAQITTFPIIALAFGQYSPLALIANLLIQPLVPLVMLLTFAAGIAGVILPGIASVVGWPAQIVLKYMTDLTGWMSSSPLAYGEISLSGVITVGIYLGLIVIIIYLKRQSKHSFRQDNIVE